MKVHASNNILFRGTLIARAKAIGNNSNENYKLYDLTHEDKDFIKELSSHVNLEQRMTGLYRTQYDDWKHILDSSLKTPYDGVNKGILLVDKKNIPCGILRYSEDSPGKFKINYLCTWPTETNVRKPLAGKTLVMYLFKKCNTEKGTSIELDAVKHGVFDPMKRYMDLGFKIFKDGNWFFDKMNITLDAIRDSIIKYKNIIKIKSQKNQPNINLSNILKLK